MFSCTIATRQSPLALWQANFVKSLLEQQYPNATVSLLTLTTQGDKILDTPLAKIGGKGLFVKELEQALIDGRADIAVHSLKDVPMSLPAGLVLGAYLSRHSPTDAFVSNRYAHLDDLPQGAVVGTSSLRRECQLRAYRPDLVVRSLRGNVGTVLPSLMQATLMQLCLLPAVCSDWGLMSVFAMSLTPSCACLRWVKVCLLWSVVMMACVRRWHF